MSTTRHPGFSSPSDDGSEFMTASDMANLRESERAKAVDDARQQWQDAHDRNAAEIARLQMHALDEYGLAVQFDQSMFTSMLIEDLIQHVCEHDESRIFDFKLGYERTVAAWLKSQFDALPAAAEKALSEARAQSLLQGVVTQRPGDPAGGAGYRPRSN